MVAVVVVVVVVVKQNNDNKQLYVTLSVWFEFRLTSSSDAKEDNKDTQIESQRDVSTDTQHWITAASG